MKCAKNWILARNPLFELQRIAGGRHGEPFRETPSTDGTNQRYTQRARAFAMTQIAYKRKYNRDKASRLLKLLTLPIFKEKKKCFIFSNENQKFVFCFFLPGGFPISTAVSAKKRTTQAVIGSTASR